MPPPPALPLQMLSCLSSARTWLERSRELTDTLAEAGKASHGGPVPGLPMLIRQAREHAVAAASQPLKLERDVEKLVEASKLYCLCEQLYDEGRPMLSCDYCQDWFHYECVGLQPPCDDDDDEQVAPADWK